MHVISGFASFDHAVQAMQVAEAIAEEDRGLTERMSQTRRRDLEHNTHLLHQTRRALLRKETLKPAPIQHFTTVSTAGKVRLPRSDQHQPPASLSPVLEHEIAANLLAATPA